MASRKRGERGMLDVEKRGWRGVGRERGGKVSHAVVVSMTTSGFRLYVAAVYSAKVTATTGGWFSIIVSAVSTASGITSSIASGMGTLSRTR